MKVFKKELPSWNEILKIDESSIEMQTESKDGRIFGSIHRKDKMVLGFIRS
jgi:hypothetical protein